jgi:hypothetical protein
MFPQMAIQSFKKHVGAGLVALTVVLATGAAVAPSRASAELARPAYSWTMAAQPTFAVFSPRTDAPEFQEVRLFQKGKRLERWAKKGWEKFGKPLLRQGWQTFECSQFGMCRY